MKAFIQSDADALENLRAYVPHFDDPITALQATVMLEEQQENDDNESAHSNADDILCRLLWSLGHKDVVIAWQKVGKWYA